MHVHCCAHVLFYALSSFHFRLLPVLKVIEMPGHGPKSLQMCVHHVCGCIFICVCVCVCLCVCACTYNNSLILNTAYLPLQSLSSLFPVFLHISAIYRVENPEWQMRMEFYYSPHILALLFLSLSLLHPVFHLSFYIASMRVIAEYV